MTHTERTQPTAISIELTQEKRAEAETLYRGYYDHAISLGGSERSARTMAKHAVEVSCKGIRVVAG